MSDSNSSNPKRIPKPETKLSQQRRSAHELKTGNAAGQKDTERGTESAARQSTQRSRLGTVRPKTSGGTSGAGSEARNAAPAAAQHRQARRRKRMVPVGPVHITQVEEAAEPGTWTDQVRQRWNPLSSVMVSMIFHSLLLIGLALMTSLWPSTPEGVTIDAVMVDMTVLEQPEANTESITIEIPEEELVSPIEMEESEIADDFEELTPELEENNDWAKSETVVPTPAEPAPLVDNSALPVGGGLEGRNAESRAKRASERGGSPASEDAVELGLKWLAAHQRVDGSWRLDLKNTPCKGRCKHSGTRESSTAATGLSLLAFLGAGYTHKEGPYQDQVERGLQYLRSKIRTTKFGGTMAEPTMYSHAIATMAIGEAYALTGDTQLHSTLEAAMKYIISSQHKGGGWRYNPQQPGDMTVTGWQIMALKSCELAGLDVPQDVWKSTESFVISMQSNYGSTYGYNKPGAEKAPTAVGLLARMYMGWGRNHLPLQEGAALLAEWGPSQSDIYFDYYATLVQHHLRTDHWDSWNESMRDYLVATQDRRGHQKGSWHFKDKHGSVGGRLYTTAMAIMILEVYYRYLPLYNEDAVEKR